MGCEWQVEAKLAVTRQNSNFLFRHVPFCSALSQAAITYLGSRVKMLRLRRDNHRRQRQDLAPWTQTLQSFTLNVLELTGETIYCFYDFFARNPLVARLVRQKVRISFASPT